MGAIAISVEGLGKRYRIDQHQEPYGRLTESLWGALRAPIEAIAGRRNDRSEWIWALNNVSFEVPHGDVLGVIGPNGAGKSTLLKVLSRITEPTTGRAYLHGRVGSLLEVGTGFHPELTGRENIFMSGAVLGMRRAEINRKFDQIVDFAGIQVAQFLDTPVKRYSSGMQVRLGFAVAAHLEPEILIVDEVLAVGDAAFQKKCLGRMGDVAHEGRTVLFVSHNMAAIETLCRKAIWIDHGLIVEDGLAANVATNYLSTSSTVLTDRIWNDPTTAPGNERVRLTRARVRPEGGDPGDPMTLQTPVVLEFEYWNLVADARLELILEIYNQQRVLVIQTSSANDTEWNGRPLPVGGFRSFCHIPGNLLNADTHSVTLRIVRDEGHPDVTEEDVLVFPLSDPTENAAYRKWLGAVRPNLAWTTNHLAQQNHSR